MPDDSRTEYASLERSSADRSGTDHYTAETRARGETGWGSETMCGGIGVDMLMMAIHERTTSC